MITRCSVCGEPHTKEAVWTAGSFTPPECATCDPILEAHPELYSWIQKIVEHAIEEAMERHAEGHASPDYKYY